ncbi:DNA polymerase III subunit delta [Oribacterium sp. HCP28S3_H8]|uniref:DNA polymerase III subunit delta n=1 Tax=Oribacterium sp. HCP28S3_H8 TaxID=3438945 RepID=UPI003F8AAD7E
MAYKKNEDQTRYLKLNEDLKSGQYQPVYLLYGEENYLKLSYKKMFRKAIGGEDELNYTYYDGAPELDTLIGSLETMPFMLSTDRLVVVSGSGYCMKSAPERLIEYLPTMPSSSHLMLIEDDVDKRNKLYKLIQKLGFVCELGEQDPRMLAGWAARYLDRAGKKIRSSTMTYLLTKTGSSMDNIVSELEKLIAYTGERDVIEDADVTEICSQNVEDRVFDMISELSLGNTGKAMQYYSDLLTLQEAPMKILALMRRNFNQLLLTKESMMQGMNRKDAAEYVHVSPWVVQKLMDQARHYTLESLVKYISRCMDYDEAIKNGNLTDQLAVELLLTS